MKDKAFLKQNHKTSSPDYSSHKRMDKDESSITTELKQLNRETYAEFVKNDKESFSRKRHILRIGF